MFGWLRIITSTDKIKWDDGYRYLPLETASEQTLLDCHNADMDLQLFCFLNSWSESRFLHLSLLSRK
jgi:hypothetical protein